MRLGPVWQGASGGLYLDLLSGRIYNKAYRMVMTALEVLVVTIRRIDPSAVNAVHAQPTPMLVRLLEGRVKLNAPTGGNCGHS